MSVTRHIGAPLLCLCLLAACGSEPPREQTRTAGPAVAGQGQLQVVIQPDHPAAGDCLRAVVRGGPHSPAYRWEVNGRQVESGNPGELCSDAFRRGDRVSVQVGTATAAVTIGNSPPRVTGISATPKELLAGSDVEVFPVAEDRDGDTVEFRYQWLINGEADPFLTEAKLPGRRFARGDRVQVQITPFDGTSEGAAYSSYATTIPNAPPQILSRPPQQFEAWEYRYQVRARDPDGDKLVYALAEAPQGMSVDRATGLVAWPLGGVQAGTYPLRIVVRDADGAEASQEFTLTLGANPQPAGAARL